MGKQADAVKALARAVRSQQETRQLLEQLQKELKSAQIVLGRKIKARDEAEAVFQASLQKIEAKAKLLTLLEHAIVTTIDPVKAHAKALQRAGLVKNLEKASATHAKIATTRDRTKRRYGAVVAKLQALEAKRREIETACRQHLQEIATAQMAFMLTTTPRKIAESAGVPDKYLDDVHIIWRTSVIHIYFGGKGKALGANHGHYIMKANGTVMYRRDPGEPHGPQNRVRRTK